MTAVPLRVAVLGAGTVGREVVRTFVESPELLATPDGPRLELVGVAVRDVDAARRRGVAGALLTDAPAHLVAATEVDVVVELIGGLEPARTLVLAALHAGKAVVTANKALLARHGPEVEAVARAAGAAIRFEAAVAGGTPVLRPLAEDLRATRVTRIRGIVNGTTNYILSAMTSEGRTYDDVLADAQARGYAEADPTADVEGYDAASKLVVLARLAFGRWLDVAQVPCSPRRVDGTDGRPGITGVTGADIETARADAHVIKLVALAQRSDDGAIEAAVVPSWVPESAQLGRTDGVENRVEIDAEPLGRVAFAGPGAGGPATATAVAADLVALSRGAGSTWAALHAAPAGLVDVARPDGPTRATADGTCYPIEA
ncbi:MAG: homoserine dehydrogenase [Chloroflexota bacterium]